MRALWTAATGMKAQQLNMDVISNNLSNVNTAAYKNQRAEFKDLMYSAMKKTNLKDEVGRPVNLEIGFGVMTGATTRFFKQGSFMETQNDLDVALQGDGFFQVQLPNEEVRYTRDGSFKLSVEENVSKLVTSEGYYVLGEDGPIEIPNGYTDFKVGQLGHISAKDEDGNLQDLGRIRLAKFINNEGLLSEGENLYKETVASGNAIEMEPDTMEAKMRQGYLEMSNVQVVDEMIRMITAQRAYEINSKAITTSDEMMQLVNNLKR
jgi:flagellar basal-body rod protein FlgG